MNKVVVLQPGYLPWIGFFKQMMESDIFVYYDDVQFDKHGWRNRNRVKTASGVQWISVPVRHKNLGKPLINEVLIDNSKIWRKKHIELIRQSYSKSPYINKYLPDLEGLLMSQDWEFLVDLNLSIVDLICEWLSIEVNIKRSSEIEVYGGKNTRIINICNRYNADVYLSGDAAKEYLDVGLFESNNIKVEWNNYKPIRYKQLYGEFVPNLSIIDLLFNMGESSIDFI